MSTSGMKRKILIGMLAALICLLAAAPALAANVFAFTEKKGVEVFEGDTLPTEIRRDGKFAEGGEIVYTSAKPEIASVAADGTITGVTKGKTRITAVLVRDGKNVAKAQLDVRVVRRVTKVTLDLTGLSVYEPEAALEAGLVQELPEHRVILLGAGKKAKLDTTCTPADADNRKINYSVTDAGVVKLQGNTLRGLQRGECDLIVQSVQNPEITETFHIIVTQPVKSIRIESAAKSVAAGGQLQLTAVCQPDDATVKEVVWDTRRSAVATVDQNGVVTGVSKGKATIEARAADGSGVVATIAIEVTQMVTSVTFNQEQIEVLTGRSVQASVTALPREANDKSMDWSSSDESIATVANGKITGVKAGTCTVTATSRSNPAVSATIQVYVSQRVTSIEFTNPAEELSILVGQSRQLTWTVLPDDATNKEVTFKSAHNKVVTVDANGIITGLARGAANVTAYATDGSQKSRSVKITVIQPVTGVEIRSQMIYVQRGSGTNIRAIVQPRDANNQKVYWSIDNEYVGSIRSSGTSTGHVSGLQNGTANVLATTEDGGYTAATTIRVGDFNTAVMIEEIRVNDQNEIRIVLRNTSSDLIIESVHFRIECYDLSLTPMICNTDGMSTSFEGSYPGELYPQEKTSYGLFRFKDMMPNMPTLGAVVLTIDRWTDSDGVTWTIPESERPTQQWARLNIMQ